MAEAQWKEDLKHPWLRGILAIIGVTLVVNIGFISMAFINKPNLVVKDYYEKGQEYFHAEAARNEAEHLGFRLQLLPPATPKLNVAQTYRLYVVDHTGKPWNSGEGILFAYRPNDSSKDFRLPLPKADTGTFAANVTFSQPGNWDLIAQIMVEGRKLDVAQRIFVFE
ncbi:MAG TPA: FixH family protein [Mariprofundaceae bacterium]|nr:FixH family protein [Mariprofundaceae bacterium]